MTTDLALMYKLYNRVEGGLLVLMKSLSVHLRERGEKVGDED